MFILGKSPNRMLRIKNMTTDENNNKKSEMSNKNPHKI